MFQHDGVTETSPSQSSIRAADEGSNAIGSSSPISPSVASKKTARPSRPWSK